MSPNGLEVEQQST